jgi:hypothetical protein
MFFVSHVYKIAAGCIPTGALAEKENIYVFSFSK